MNNYYYSKKYKALTFVHPVEGLNPLLKEEENAPVNSFVPDGRLTAKKVESCFANSQQIVFEVTNKCNLSCKYCALGELYSQYDITEKKELSFQLAKNLIDYYKYYQNTHYIHSLSPTTLFSFYGGEPLMNIKLIKEIVEYVEANFPNHSFSMTTNGFILDKYIDYLVEKNFSISVSLDGNEYNNSYRVTNDSKPSFHRVLNNIKLIQQKYSSYYENKKIKN